MIARRLIEALEKVERLTALMKRAVERLSSLKAEVAKGRADAGNRAAKEKGS